jgi:hypothetical protein
MTVVFHSTQRGIWDALRSAWQAAGFVMVRSSVLDKTQGSFKQVTTTGAVKGDALILLQKPTTTQVQADSPGNGPEQLADPWQLIQERLASLDGSSPERTRQALFSYMVRHYLNRGLSVPLDARDFFSELERRYEQHEGRSYLLPTR